MRMKSLRDYCRPFNESDRLSLSFGRSLALVQATVQVFKFAFRLVPRGMQNVILSIDVLLMDDCSRRGREGVIDIIYAQFTVR